MKILFGFIFLFSFLNTIAQLSGSYTIGTSGANYTSFSSAISALNTNGINGNVEFSVASGMYNESITINNITGSANYTITFKSTAADSTLVTLSSASSSNFSSNFTMNLNGAKNIIFKHITIERSGNNDYSNVIGMNNSAQNIKFQSCIIKNQLTNSGNDYASLLVGKNLSSSLTDLEISNCHFMNGSYGIYFQGPSSASLANNMKVTNSKFENQYRTAIYAAYQNSAEIVGNILTSSASSSVYRAMDFLYCNNQTIIKNNKINILQGTGIYMLTSQGSGANKTSIFNNFITIATGTSYGIYLSNSGSMNIYFNSIYLNGPSTLGLYVNGTSSNNINYANNIIYNPGGGKLMQVGTATNIPFTYLNHNDYHTSGSYFGDWKSTTNISNFAAWKTACSNDASSLNVIPGFVSSTDLHIQGMAVQRKGTSAVTTPYPGQDIDGNQRHYSKPDIGAHELSFDDLKLSSMIYDNSSCAGQNKALKIYIKNIGNSPVTANLPVKYKIDNTTKSELFNIISMMPGDSLGYTFTNLINSGSQGTFTLKTWFELQGDIDNSNDSASKSTSVSLMPVVSLPQDTLLCANLSLTLDAGPGFDEYLWSNNQTTQQITIDTSDIGLTSKFISVRVTKNDCSTKDSTLVWFKLCTGIEDINPSQNIFTYPNPVKNTLFLSGLNNIANFHVQIFSLDGNLMHSEFATENHIYVGNLSNGIYIIQLTTNESTKYLKFNKE